MLKCKFTSVRLILVIPISILESFDQWEALTTRTYLSRNLSFFNIFQNGLKILKEKHQLRLFILLLNQIK